MKVYFLPYFWAKATKINYYKETVAETLRSFFTRTKTVCNNLPADKSGNN